MLLAHVNSEARVGSIAAPPPPAKLQQFAPQGRTETMDTTFTGELLEQQGSMSGGRSRTLSREAHSEAEHVLISHNYDNLSFLSDEALPSERARNNIERQQLRERGRYSNSHRERQSTEYSYTTFAHVSPNSAGELLSCIAIWLP